MTKYEEIKQRQQELIKVGSVKRGDCAGGRYDFGSTTCSEVMWDDIQLLLKALEMAHHELQVENTAYERYTPDYWLEFAEDWLRTEKRIKSEKEE
jgi:hypothetical protein